MHTPVSTQLGISSILTNFASSTVHGSTLHQAVSTTPTHIAYHSTYN